MCIIGRQVPGALGLFEVEIEGVKIIHSSRNGNGFVDTPEKTSLIIEAIKSQL